jgi:hypothetical protein
MVVLMKDQLDHLFNKPMDRGQFLSHIGFAALTVVGVTSVLKALSERPHHSASHTTKHGFGGGPFGI